MGKAVSCAIIASIIGGISYSSSHQIPTFIEFMILYYILMGKK